MSHTLDFKDLIQKENVKYVNHFFNVKYVLK